MVDANCGARSETMVSGSPWRHTTSHRNNSAKPKASMVVWHGMNCRIFESPSTTTHIASNPSHSGNPMMKSIEISSLGLSGTDGGRRTPNVGCLEFQDCWQSWQFWTYRSTSLHIPFQYYTESSRSNVFARPGCPTNAVSSCSCIMRRRNSSLSGTYKLPLNLSHPLSSVHSATVISCGPLYIRSASSIVPSSRSVPYAFVIRLGFGNRGTALCG